MDNSWAIIFGDYINAITIVNSLKVIEWGGKIVCVTKKIDNKVLADLIKGIEVWHLDYENSEDVFKHLSKKIPSENKKILFFTSEEFHSVLTIIEEFLPNSYYWTGDLSKMEIILDRFKFYQFIETNQIAIVPKTIDSKVDPFQIFTPPFFLRIRKSWSGVNRRKGVIQINSQEDLINVEKLLLIQGINKEEWCYQEILSLKTEYNFSICGWHQPGIQRYFVTHKIRQHPGKTGNGDIVGLLDPLPGLMDITSILLNALNYSGPFELEFVYDEKDHQFKIIELNPRFWMQHGLIEANTEFELVRRYLGEKISNKGSQNIRIIYWINSIYAVLRLIKFEVSILKYIFTKRKIITPPLCVTLSWLPQYLKIGRN